MERCKNTRWDRLIEIDSLEFRGLGFQVSSVLQVFRAVRIQAVQAFLGFRVFVDVGAHRIWGPIGP